MVRTNGIVNLLIIVCHFHYSTNILPCVLTLLELVWCKMLSKVKLAAKVHAQGNHTCFLVERLNKWLYGKVVMGTMGVHDFFYEVEDVWQQNSPCVGLATYNPSL